MNCSEVKYSKYPNRFVLQLLRGVAILVVCISPACKPGKSPLCGDGVIELPEKCDDGNQNGSYQHCSSKCTGILKCGDGVVQLEEACDGGSSPDGRPCLPDCSGYSDEPTSGCGDGVVTPPEVCDDGLTNGRYGRCNFKCTGVLRCGDGILQGPEVCDGGVRDGKPCLRDCSGYEGSASDADRVCPKPPDAQ